MRAGSEDDAVDADALVHDTSGMADDALSSGYLNDDLHSRASSFVTVGAVSLSEYQPEPGQRVVRVRDDYANASLRSQSLAGPEHDVEVTMAAEVTDAEAQPLSASGALRVHAAMRRALATGEVWLTSHALHHLPTAPLFNTLALQLGRLQKLHLSNNRLRMLPPSFCPALQHCLTELSVSFNLLHALPDDIGLLRRLRRLELRGNRLQWLPDGMGQLTALEVLVVAENAMVRAHAARKMRRARFADACARRQAALPETLAGCTALTSLDACRNRITMVPASLMGLTQLCDLRLGYARAGAEAASLRAPDRRCYRARQLQPPVHSRGAPAARGAATASCTGQHCCRCWRRRRWG